MGSLDRVRKELTTLARGVVMGVVELVPGVSGGTMALMLGIYGELIDAINATFAWIGGALRRMIMGSRGSLRPVKAPPVLFLSLLTVGMAVALLFGSHLVSELLRSARGLTYSFFCGLVLASIVTPLRLMERRGVREAALIVAGAVASFVATGLAAGVESEPGFPLLLLSGALAVVVLVLPGVSGSFVLIALGSYGYIVDRLRGVTAGELAESVLPLATCVLGMALGLVTVTRVISFLFARYRSLTLAVLTGLMVGSLRALWPFFLDGESVPLSEVGKLGVGLLPLTVAAVAGAATVLLLSWAASARR